MERRISANADERPDGAGGAAAPSFGAEGVAAEMTAIFGAPARRAESAALPPSRAIVPVLDARRRRSRWPHIAGLVAIVVVACLAGLWAWRSPPVERRRVAVRVDRSAARQPPAVISVIPPTTPVETQPRVIVMSPAAPRQQAATADAPAAPAPARREGARMPPAARLVANATPHDDRRVGGEALDDQRCADEREEARAFCLHPQVMAADRRLRRAYDDAVDRGADRRTLMAYRRDWIAAQRRAAWDPDTALERMRGLERDISRAGY